MRVKQNREKLEELNRIQRIKSEGFAGVLSSGMIVDRRLYPKAIPMQKNSMLGIPEPEKMVKCWECGGDGVGAITIPGGKKIPCHRCNATGSCPEIMREWQKKGRLMKDARIAQRKTLRVWAKENDIPIVKASQAETGIINPDSLGL